MKLTPLSGLSLFTLFVGSLVGCAGVEATNDAPVQQSSDLSEPRSCGGFAGLTCGAGEFCDYEPGQWCGGADDLGRCKKRPEICLEVYEPVCGCDSKTYSNRCDAAAAGTGVFAVGACAAPPPVVCTAEYDPVCGMDGKTYSNACHARAAGQRELTPGECTPATETSCGGKLGITCGPRQYCHYAIGSTCGWADATGVCRIQPDLCTADFDPVCGCDGKTYSNECHANGAGVSALRKGACN